MHVNGTTAPGSPPSPGYLKAQVYLPPSFVKNNPALHTYILDTVQQFLATVGVATVMSWATRARNELGFSLTQAGNPRPNTKPVGIPAPEPGTALYTIPGYEVEGNAITQPSSSPDEYGFVDDYAGVSAEVLALIEEKSALEYQIGILTSANEALEAEVGTLRGRLQLLSGVSVRTPTKSQPITPKRSTPFTSQPASRGPFVTVRKHATGAVKSPRNELPSPAPGESSMSAKGKGRQDETLLSAFLNANGLSHLHFAIVLISENATPDEQVPEIMKLGISQDIARKIVGAISIDQQYI